jgi:hypothetical protein
MRIQRSGTEIRDLELKVQKFQESRTKRMGIKRSATVLGHLEIAMEVSS